MELMNQEESGTEEGIGDLEVSEVVDEFNPELDYETLEYFRKQGKAIINGDGDFEQDDRGINIRTRGNRKGIFLAFVDKDEKVCIGYSMLHRNDRFDYRQGIRVEGWGRWLAYMKAVKHRDHSAFLLARDSNARQAPSNIVKIPHSMFNNFAHFIIRCQNYYQDKTLPAWATSMIAGVYKEEPDLPL